MNSVPAALKRRGLGEVSLRVVDVPDRDERLAVLGAVVVALAVTEDGDGRKMPPGGGAS